jgi:glycosyltransferase involved in cell wall biosynthesis
MSYPIDMLGILADVTVLIPSRWNRGEWRDRALRSVEEQTIGKVPTLVVIGLGKHEAYNQAMNVDTEFVAILDDDDYMLPNHLETLVAAQLESDADVVWSMIEVTDGTNSVRWAADYTPDRLDDFNFMYNGYMFRSSLLREYGGHSGDGLSDWKFWIWARDRGAKFKAANPPEPTLVVNIHEGNLMMRPNVIDALKQFNESPPPVGFQRAPFLEEAR